MVTVVTRRQVLRGAGALALATFAAPINGRGVLARQSATPAADSLAALGLPELTITPTNEAYTVSETALTAGRYLVTLDNQSDTEVYAQFVSLDEVLTVEMGAAALAAGEAEMVLDWFYKWPAPGGSTAFPGTVVRFVVDLHPGVYAVHHRTPGLPLPPVALTVSGDFPSDPLPIDAGTTLTMGEMAFETAGAFSPGRQIVRFDNAGDQHHFAVILGVPDGTEVEDFLALGAAMANPGATPAPLALTFEDLRFVFESAIQSPGTSMWGEVALEPGTYILSCFAPDAASGVPHSMLGMTSVVVVA